jgi:DNA-binding LacI/PurR family transcriptional regulator
MAVRSNSKPTLHDIARTMGVSVATVSRALHRAESTSVSAETRERIREAARTMGYSPNLLGRSLVTGRTNNVSYWTFHAFSSYYAQVASQISREATKRGYHILLNDTADPAHQLEATGTGERGRGFSAASFDGIIACDVAFPENAYAAALKRTSIPLIGMGLNYPTDGEYVGLDLTRGTTQAIQHLIAQGCRRIAHVSDAYALEKEDPRALVYEATLREAGLEPEIIPVVAHRRNYARAAMHEYAKEHGTKSFPDALFCVNDEVAVGAYRGLADLGIEVPDDILLVGCDGIEETEYHRCPITTIVTPVTEMCRLAWDMLEVRLRDLEAPPQQVLLEPQLVLRRSSGES